MNTFYYKYNYAYSLHSRVIPIYSQMIFLSGMTYADQNQTEEEFAYNISDREQWVTI